MTAGPGSVRRPLGRRGPFVLLVLIVMAVGGYFIARGLRETPAGGPPLQASIPVPAAAGDPPGDAATEDRAAEAFDNYLSDGSRGAIRLDGGTLTRFILRRYERQLPASIVSFNVSLHEPGVTVSGEVNLEQYFTEMGFEAPASLGSYLKGLVPFRVSGRFEAGGGEGVFTVEGLNIGGLPVPLALVEQVAGGDSPAERGSAESVLVQRFPLPAGIERARLSGRYMEVNG